MRKVITITLNPSLDATLITEHLNIGYRNHVAAARRLDASGRGVNLSRALDRLQTPTYALLTLGNDVISRAYKGLMAEEAFPSTIIPYEGLTRSDTIIVDKISNTERTETHIVDEDSVYTLDNVQKLREKLSEITQSGDIVVCAGTLPRQSLPDVYRQLTEVAREAGAMVVVMAGGEPLEHALKAAPDMVVITQLEAESLFNYPVRTLPDMVSAARKLQERGTKQVLLVANDYSTVILADDPHIFTTEVDALNRVGTESGVVDALLAAYLTAIVNGTAHDEALLQGEAALAFAIEQIGNEFGTAEQIQDYVPRVRVKADETYSSDAAMVKGDSG